VDRLLSEGSGGGNGEAGMHIILTTRIAKKEMDILHHHENGLREIDDEA
jgi:hypothetical protein